MSRTQSHYHRSNMRNRSMNADTDSSFMNVRQTYIYNNLNQPKNKEGQFECVQKKKPRTFWEMKKHTYEFDWPKKEQREKSLTTRAYANQSPHLDMKFELPKYGLKQSPLHVQRQTLLKIGHTTMVDSIYIK